MPKFEALYYPSFEPSERWLLRYLLVFDRISTIVPETVDYKFSRGFDAIRKLLPDAFDTVSPTADDKNYAYSDFNFKRMDKCCLPN